jgi:hypothetical protein
MTQYHLKESVMQTKSRIGIAIALIMVVFVSVSYPQGNTGDVYWRIDPSVKSCSMVIDRSLTQAQWKTFVQQVGAISSNKSLASTETQGAMNFSVGIEYGRTPVDQHNPAWINTFVHPDADCPLGDAISYPALWAKMGVSENMDIGTYLTRAPDANYGMVGGEVKYRFVEESETLPAAAVRGSVTILTGVSDFNLNIYGIEVLVSKTIGMFSPYTGLRGNLAVGTETTSKVDLKTESVVVPQGYAGVSCSLWRLNLAAEYDLAYVNTFAFSIGFRF